MKRIGIFLVFFVFCTSLFFLFPQHVTAIGETTLVQITGPSQPPGFAPALLTVHLYDTVVFVNQSSAPHAVASTDGSFSSPAIPVGRQWRVTFSSLGAHEYHATDATQRMVGEILVVANSVSLLPTPVPQVEATVIALIKAGKHPPDTIVLPVIATPTVKNKTNVAVVSTLLSPSTLIIAGSTLLLLMLILLAVILYRRRAKRVRDEEEMDMLLDGIVPKPVQQKPPVVSSAVSVEVVAPVKKRLSLLAAFHRKRSSDDDDIDDEDEE